MLIALTNMGVVKLTDIEESVLVVKALALDGKSEVIEVEEADVGVDKISPLLEGKSEALVVTALLLKGR